MARGVNQKRTEEIGGWLYAKDASDWRQLRTEK